MAKKTVKQEADQQEAPNLRRSTRSTRGSVKPVVDLVGSDGEESEDAADAKEVIEIADADFEPELDTKQKPSARKSSSGVTVKKEPTSKRRSSTKADPKRVSKQEQAQKDSKKEPTEVLEEDTELTADGNEIQYELSEAEFKEINHAFDMNRASTSDEVLNTDGLRTAIRSLGFEPRGDEIKKLVKQFSKKGGKINRDAFQKIMAYKFGSSPGTKLNNLNDEISKVFNLLDLDKTGFITFENLKSISKELNEELTDDDILEMVQEADLDGDNMVNKLEFERIMKKTSLY